MNPLLKLFLYPLAITLVILLVIGCNWVVTAFFALVLNTTLADVAKSPIIILYVLSGFGAFFLCFLACTHIDEEL
jgi:hypothetical protein